MSAGSVHFIGRFAESKQLADELIRTLTAQSSHQSFVVISGPHGVGATSFVRHVLDTFTNAPVLWANAPKVKPAFDAPGTTILSATAKAKSSTNPAVASTARHAARIQQHPTPEARLAAAVDYLTGHGDTPIIAVIDNVQNADSEAQEILNLAAVTPSDRKFAVVIIEQHAPSEPLSKASQAFLRRHDSVHIQLAPLSETETGHVVHSLTGSFPAPDDLRELHDQTGGLPLPIQEAVRRTPTGTRFTPAGESYQHSLNRLPAQALQVLFAAVVAPELGFSELLTMADVPLDRRYGLAKTIEMERLGVIDFDRFTWSHPEVAKCVKGRLAPRLEQELHKNAVEFSVVDPSNLDNMTAAEVSNWLRHVAGAGETAAAHAAAVPAAIAAIETDTDKAAVLAEFAFEHFWDHYDTSPRSARLYTKIVDVLVGAHSGPSDLLDLVRDQINANPAWSAAVKLKLLRFGVLRTAETGTGWTKINDAFESEIEPLVDSLPRITRRPASEIVGAFRASIARMWDRDDLTNDILAAHPSPLPGTKARHILDVLRYVITPDNETFDQPAVDEAVKMFARAVKSSGRPDFIGWIAGVRMFIALSTLGPTDYEIEKFLRTIERPEIGPLKKRLLNLAAIVSIERAEIDKANRYQQMALSQQGRQNQYDLTSDMANAMLFLASGKFELASDTLDRIASSGDPLEMNGDLSYNYIRARVKLLQTEGRHHEALNVGFSRLDRHTYSPDRRPSFLARILLNELVLSVAVLRSHDALTVDEHQRWKELTSPWEPNNQANRTSLGYWDILESVGGSIRSLADKVNETATEFESAKFCRFAIETRLVGAVLGVPGLTVEQVAVEADAADLRFLSAAARASRVVDNVIDLRIRVEEPDAAGSGLTGEELDVVRLAVEGLSDQQIAANQGCSVFTVNKRMSRAMRTLNATSRAEVVQFAQQMKMAG